MLALAMLVACALGFIHVKAIYGKITAIKCAVLGVFDACVFFVLCCAALFSLDMFSVNLSVIAVDVCMAVVAIILGIIKKENLKAPVLFDKKETIVFVCVLGAVFILSGSKFGFYGMGQDEGGYQTKAIEFIYGNNERVFEFEEYKNLSSDEDREVFFGYVHGLGGYVQYDKTLPFMSEEEYTSTMQGVFHSIPIFPAFMALFGSVFGLGNMMQCQTLFFILYAMLAWFAFAGIEAGFLKKSVCLALLIASPIAIWTSKSALFEMLLAAIIAAYVMLILEKDRRLKYLSVVPLICFSFYHITIYTLLPLFVLIYWAMYFAYKDRNFLKICLLMLGSYFAGFIFMFYISPQYTNSNYMLPISVIVLLEGYEIIAFIAACTGVVAVLTGILLVLDKRGALFPQKAVRAVYGRRKALLIAVTSALMILWLYRVAKIVLAGNIRNIWTDGLASASFAGGIALLFVCVAAFYFKKKDFWTPERYIAAMLFVYMLLVNCVLLRASVVQMYYYSRYLVPYTLIIFVMALYLFGRTPDALWIAMLAGSCVVYAKPISVMISGDDDTKITWDNMETILGALDGKDNSAVVIENDLWLTLALPVKAAGNDVYVATAEDINRIVLDIEDKYSEVYCITNEKEIEGGDEDMYSLKAKMRNVDSEDYVSDPQPLTGYAQEFLTTTTSISIYRYQTGQYEYYIYDEDFEGSGFGILEGTFAWTSAEESSVSCWFDKGEYTLSLTLGAYIPLESLGLSEYNISVYVNGEYVGDITVDAVDTLYTIDIPEEYTKNGENTISFESKTWRPSDYGANDSRTCGFAFSGIELAAKN